MYSCFTLFSLLATATVTISSAQTPDGSVDIGSVGLVGSSEDLGNGAYRVSGSGYDIWGHWDQFHYMYFNRTGDVTVTCLVNDFTGSQIWMKGGIMVRNGIYGEKNEGRSANAMIAVTGWGLSHSTRRSDRAKTVRKASVYETKSVWLRLVKQGSTVTSYVKRDDEYGFTQYHTEQVMFQDPYHVGIAVTSKDNSQLATIDISNFEILDEVLTLPGLLEEIGDTGTKQLKAQEVAEGQWSMTSGGNVGGTEDNFGFFSTERSGDVTATLQLNKLIRYNNDSAGGLMIRASKDTDSTHVSLLVNAKKGITLYSRSEAGGDTVTKHVGAWHEDIMLRLVKTGDTVEASYKHITAPEWFVLGSATADLSTAATFHVGKAAASGQYGRIAEITSTGEFIVEANV
mmetsp:Transcript_13145/g.27913  ORF Transcript_13145/g.27913 Transcript_13145/m.27913 type:complete len:400 (-) Transcript_13145:531-1730(-)